MSGLTPDPLVMKWIWMPCHILTYFDIGLVDVGRGGPPIEISEEDLHVSDLLD